MDLLEGIKTRRSTRALMDQPIDKMTLKELITLAGQAPSAINLQPWELTVVSGKEKERLSRILVKRMKEKNISCGPAAKRPLDERFMNRQRGLLECIRPYLPEDTGFLDFINEGSCRFYGAPTTVIILLDKVFSSARLTDIGALVGYLVLAAHALGLGTCPIGLITAFDDEIREFLNLPEEKKVVLGIAIGYADPGAPVNKAKSDRVPLEELVKWRE